MWYPASLKWISPRSRRRAQPRRARGCRLAVETLESRDVPSYVVTDLGLLPGSASAYAEAVNAAGDVVGYDTDSSNSGHAFLWRNGSLIDLGTLGGANSIAYGINDADQVVGSSDTGLLDADGNAIWHAFLWQNGVMTDLGALPDSVGSVAYDINNQGQIVGASTVRIDLGFWYTDIADGVTWQSGTITELTPNVYQELDWGAINDAGEIVGGAYEGQAFAWQNGARIYLDQYDVYNQGYFSSSSATAVNDSGWVAGWCAPPLVPGQEAGGGPPRAAVWQNDVVNQLNFDIATGINNAGQVIGQRGSTPVLWQDGVLTDLSTQLPVAYSTVQVKAINDAGQIVGTEDGRALLLTLQPELAINNVSVTEGNSGTVYAVFTVTLSGHNTSPVTVNYATADGSATAGSDYQSTSGTLTFAPGETSKTITVQVIGDRLAEPNETFVVNLSGATSANIASGEGEGTIMDDEPRLSISDVAKLEGKKGQTTLFTFTVTLSATYDQPVTVSFRTVDGSARTSDSDYVAKTGTLTFAPGETTKTITIVVNGDSKKEVDETFFVDLFASSSNSLFTKYRGIGTILNDD
jgi:probable HAF family extracellular repeat protein